jgi:hypothetical protein
MLNSSELKLYPENQQQFPADNPPDPSHQLLSRLYSR